MNLLHKVVFVPLMFSRIIERTAAKFRQFNFIENQVSNHAYSKFLEYNLLANAENLTNFPDQHGDLPDPHKDLAVRQFEDSKRIFGLNYDCKTDVFRKPSEVQGHKKCMLDVQLMPIQLRGNASPRLPLSPMQST